MVINRINPFKISSQLETLDRQVTLDPVTPQRYRILSQQLDQTFQELKTQAVALPKLEEQAIELYGKLENKLVETEIKHIQETAQSPCSEKAIEKAKKQIQKLRKNHLLLSEDRKRIKEADEALNRVSKKPLSPAGPPMRAPLQVGTLEIYEMLDVAKHVYEGKEKEARKQFFLLTQSQKERFEEQIRHLGAEAWVEIYPTVRALMAVVNEMAENGETHLSNKEIDQFFSEIDPVSATEHRGNCITRFVAQI